jgi:hypothetical protein
VADNAAAQGDFDGSGIVDGEDHNVWRATFGSTSALADANGNGMVDAADYVIWRKNFGQQLGSTSAIPEHVPEPGSFALVLVASLALASCRRQTR